MRMFQIYSANGCYNVNENFGEILWLLISIIKLRQSTLSLSPRSRYKTLENIGLRNVMVYIPTISKPFHLYRFY